ncbi:hypothetical protein NBRC116188_05370 [Oceaniserpentilla sp. 4NH20-0058]|uniref:lipase secretion chaperone n=1 Tax=Oceaniserpentilla sp. 4NH20-0058 TaxID=3127660 RepID=UPI003109B91E
MNNKKLILAGLATVIVISGVSFLNTGSEITLIENQETSLSKYEPLTLADVWQGEVKTKNSRNLEKVEKITKQAEEDTPQESEITLDYSLIHEEIGKIRLTEDGNVIVDDIALKALRKAFPRNRLNHTPEMIEELQNIILKGLPGSAGEQASEIVKNFFDFQQAKKEMEQVYRDINIASGGHEEKLAEMKILRELYLGKEVAEQLFGTEDRNAEIMLRSIKIANDQSLTPEEKIEKRAQLNKEFIKPDVNNWENRYSAYRAELKSINLADLEKEDKKAAINDLQEKHFNKDEIETISKSNISLDF